MLMSAPQALVKTVQLALTKSTLTLAIAWMDIMDKTVKMVKMQHHSIFFIDKTTYDYSNMK